MTAASPQEDRRTARICAVKSYVRHHAIGVGAPRDLEDAIKETAVRELLAGSSAWRAMKHAIAELDRRVDATGWFGLEASR